MKIGGEAFRGCWSATIILKKPKKNFEKIGYKAFDSCKDVKEKVRN